MFQWDLDGVRLRAVENEREMSVSAVELKVNEQTTIIRLHSRV